MNQNKDDANTWFVNLQMGTGYPPTHKNIHSDQKNKKKNKLNLISQHQRRQTFSPALLAAGRRAQHRDKPPDKTLPFCNIHSSFEIIYVSS